MIEIIVNGLPGPQGSKRHVGGGRMIESSKKVAPWRQDVVAAAKAAYSGPPLDGPLECLMVFWLPRPVSAPKKRRAWACKKPDLSKLVRSTEDALTTAGVWRDDARVVRLEARKFYSGELLMAKEWIGPIGGYQLRGTGAVILVRKLEP